MRSKPGLPEATNTSPAAGATPPIQKIRLFDLFFLFVLVLYRISGFGLLFVTKPLLVKLDLSVRNSL